MNRAISKKIAALSLATASVLFCASSVFAQQSPIIFSNIAQKEVVVVDEQGNESAELTGVGVVVPGDTIVYTSTFTNQGEEIVSGIAVDNPVPSNTVYINFSARGENTQVVYSIDNGAIFGNPPELITTGENGEARTASPEEYTNIRWIYSGELAPGQSGSVSFKVRIL